MFGRGNLVSVFIPFGIKVDFVFNMCYTFFINSSIDYIPAVLVRSFMIGDPILN